MNIKVEYRSLADNTLAQQGQQMQTRAPVKKNSDALVTNFIKYAFCIYIGYVKIPQYRSGLPHFITIRCCYFSSINQLSNECLVATL